MTATASSRDMRRRLGSTRVEERTQGHRGRDGLRDVGAWASGGRRHGHVRASGYGRADCLPQWSGADPCTSCGWTGSRSSSAAASKLRHHGPAAEDVAVERRHRALRRPPFFTLMKLILSRTRMRPASASPMPLSVRTFWRSPAASPSRFPTLTNNCTKPGGLVPLARGLARRALGSVGARGTLRAHSRRLALDGVAGQG